MILMKLDWDNVAQIFNLLYRRLAAGKGREVWGASDFSDALRFGRHAECNSAIQQVANLRYKRGQAVRALEIAV